MISKVIFAFHAIDTKKWKEFRLMFEFRIFISQNMKCFRTAATRTCQKSIDGWSPKTTGEGGGWFRNV